MSSGIFSGRVGLQQRVLPGYRAPFLDALANACPQGLSVFAGRPVADENIPTTDQLQLAHFYSARNRHFLKPSSPFYLCWQANILDWLETWQPDVLIVEANWRYPTSRRAIRWMHAHHRLVIGWGLGAPALQGPAAPLLTRLRYDFLSTLDGIIAYSRRGADEYRSLGFSENCVFVAHNATTARPTRPIPIRANAFISRPIILFVGRLQARKKVDALIRACASLPTDYPPRLWIVGDGPEEAALRKLAAEIYPGSEFFGDCRGPELEALFLSADLFVLPGTGGLAVQQAMSFALPVIVAEGDGTQNDMVRPQNGWIIPSGEPQALAQAIRQALADPTRLREMGAASFQLVDQEINLEKMVETFIQALDTVHF